MHTGDLGVIDRDGYLTITGRKKDLIILSSGKNISPEEIETRLRYEPLISQAVVIGDDRPYLTALLTLDAEAVATWAERKGRLLEVEALHEDPDLIEEVTHSVERVNAQHARIEGIKRWHDPPPRLHGGRRRAHAHAQGQAEGRPGPSRRADRGALRGLTSWAEPVNDTTSGSPHPLGARAGQGGVNFSVFSKHAASIDLLLYDQADDAFWPRSSRSTRRCTARITTGTCWSTASALVRSMPIVRTAPTPPTTACASMPTRCCSIPTVERSPSPGATADPPRWCLAVTTPRR